MANERIEEMVATTKAMQNTLMEISRLTVIAETFVDAERITFNFVGGTILLDGKEFDLSRATMSHLSLQIRAGIDRVIQQLSIDLKNSANSVFDGIVVADDKSPTASSG